jgi:hypothetical protein
MTAPLRRIGEGGRGQGAREGELSQKFDERLAPDAAGDRAAIVLPPLRFLVLFRTEFA